VEGGKESSRMLNALQLEERNWEREREEEEEAGRRKR
jgi:hypothetical protein